MKKLPGLEESVFLAEIGHGLTVGSGGASPTHPGDLASLITTKEKKMFF